MNAKDKRIAERMIPKGYKLKHETNEIHIYFGQSADKPTALFFKAGARRAEKHYRFSSEEQRKSWADGRIKDFEKLAKAKAERKKKRAEFKHKYEVGDILSSSWGYEQTNWDYYQVVSTTEKSVKIAQVQTAKDYYDHDQYKAQPVKDAFIGEPKTHRVSIGYSEDSKGWVRINSYSGASEWEGKPNNGTSWY